MARDNFAAVMEHEFREEGGYVDHPQDPGGATNMGITFNVLREWRGKTITKQDVKNLSKGEAREIYEKRYWNKINGDELPRGLDLVCMDASVNSGVGRGPKWLQRALGVEPDGQIGPKTIAAAKAANPATVINKACDIRMDFLRSLPTFPTFGKGWTARVERVRKEALRMAGTAIIMEPAPHLGPKPIDAPLDVKPADVYEDQEPIQTAPKSSNWIWVIGAILAFAAIIFIVTQVKF